MEVCGCTSGPAPTQMESLDCCQRRSSATKTPAVAPAGIEAAVKEHGPKLVFLTSPNNPDGSTITEGDLRRVLSLPVLVVLDEAYVDFSTEPSRLGWVLEHTNLVVLRTFSKSAALAGATPPFLSCPGAAPVQLLLPAVDRPRLIGTAFVVESILIMLIIAYFCAALSPPPPPPPPPTHTHPHTHTFVHLYTHACKAVHISIRAECKSTFSVSGGSAGMRVGYGAFPSGLIDYMWRAKQPYNVTVASEVAARAALTNPTYLNKVPRVQPPTHLVCPPLHTL